MSNPNGPALLDLDVARRNIPGGDSGVKEMGAVLDSECERLMGELGDSLADDDAVKFRRAAHTLKGAATVFGATPVAEAARELEEIGEAGDLSKVGDRVPELESLVARLRNEIKSFIDQ